MVDLHSHIIYGIDDGAKTFEDSIELAKQAIQKGFTHIIATPHYNDFITDTFFDFRDKHCKKLNDYFIENEMNLTISCGTEVSFASNWTKVLSEPRCLINNDFILVEFSDLHIPEYYLDIIYKIIRKKITPIIAHPERCQAIQKSKKIVYELARIGAYFQCDAGSLIGQFGDRTKKCAEDLIKLNAYHFFGSDAHDIKNRNYNIIPSIQPFDIYNNFLTSKETLPELSLEDRRDNTFLGKVKRLMTN